jgi:hypothetical protein
MKKSICRIQCRISYFLQSGMRFTENGHILCKKSQLFLPVCFLSEKEVLLSVDLSYSYNDTHLKAILISIIQIIWQKNF